jgi:hypothetical protein
LKSSIHGDMWAEAPLSINQSVAAVTNSVSPSFLGFGRLYVGGPVVVIGFQSSYASICLALWIIQSAHSGFLLFSEYSDRSLSLGATASVVLLVAMLLL